MPNHVIPAKAGTSGQEVTDLLHEAPAFAGVTCEGAGVTWEGGGVTAEPV